MDLLPFAAKTIRLFSLLDLKGTHHYGFFFFFYIYIYIFHFLPIALLVQEIMFRMLTMLVQPGDSVQRTCLFSPVCFYGNPSLLDLFYFC